MNMKIVSVLVGVTISIIMVGFVLTPVINDAVDNTKVYYNNEYGPFADVPNNETVTIVVSTTIGTAGTTTLTVNGENVSTPQGPRAVLLADTFIIYQNYSNGIAFNGINGDTLIHDTDYSDITITLDGGVANITASVGDTNREFSLPYEWAYYRSNIGDYRLIDFIASNATVYINSTDQVKGCQYNTPINSFYSFVGTDVTVYSPSVSNAVANVELTDVMNNVKSFVISPSRENAGAFQFNYDVNGETKVVTPYYFVVPYKVYGQTEASIQASNILFVIPSMMLVAVIAMMVTLIRRD